MGFLLYGLSVFVLLLLVCCASLAIGTPDGGGGRGEGRSLVSFKEIRGNVSFRCSPSGPCLPCEYSEKKDVKYRCSETGYRVPLKCMEIKDKGKQESGKKTRRRLYTLNSEDQINSLQRRRLLDASSESQDKGENYTTYRSCLPAEAEEKLSVLGFEMIMVCLLLVSGFLIFIRQKRNIPFLGIGAGRFPFGSSRF